MQLFGAEFFLSLCLLIGVRECNAAAVKEPYQSLSTGQGLYNASDSVIVLNATNFKSTVYGDSKGWLVEFYNSWCGFCFRFAPTWKALASDVLPWKDIVVIAAIDCADDDNNPICREYEIMQYPMLKFFSVNAHPSSLGTVVQKGDSTEALKNNLIDRLVKEQQEGRGSSWPNINPYRNYETGNIWKAIPDTVKYFFLIFEEKDSYLGAEVILDLHNAPILQIRRVTSDNQLLCETNKVTKFPSIIAFSRNESQRFLNVNVPSREGIGKTIRTYLTSKGEEILIEESKKQSPSTSGAAISQKSLLIEEHKNGPTSEDRLYQLDLENVLRYSITHEIPLTKLMKGEKLQALKNYLSLLAGYFPFRHSSSVLEVIRDVVNKKQEISGEEFLQLVKSVEEEISSMYSGPSEWVGCKGSSRGFRGYPCGLWTLYHMLSVNFAMQNEENSQANPGEVLRAMHGYIKHFFGCADCSQHFLVMAAKNKIFQARTADENILWLWRAHNEVNARLAGDKTEDPKHTKKQYPTAEHCPQCRRANDSWDEEQVLRYLKRKYSYAAINYYGSVDKQQSNESIKLRVRHERLVPNKYMNLRKSGWDFTIFDFSICVVLYAASAAILILVCIKFAVKRSHKKKTYLSLMGRV